MDHPLTLEDIAAAAGISPRGLQLAFRQNRGTTPLGFWRDLREMAVPERLARKIALFRANGSLVQDQYDIFMEPSWAQVLIGQHILPQDNHPLAEGPSDNELREQLVQLAAVKARPLPQLPLHDQWLAAQVSAGG